VVPAGKGMGGALFAEQESAYEVASARSDDDGKASLALVDCRIVGDREKPIEEHGPCELVARCEGREIRGMIVDPAETEDLTITVADPDRKLYVYAGEDQRTRIGETAILDGKVTLLGQAGEPEIRWERVTGDGTLPIVDASSARAQVVMNKWGSSTFELSAKWGDEVAKDRVSVRADSRLTPTAIALAPPTAKSRSIVQLDGTTSTDPRGFPRSELRFIWKQVEGPKITLSSEEWPEPIFYATESGTYAFELTVSNPLRTSAPARCAVTVTE